MSTANTNSHRRCTKSRESAPSQFDEEAGKPHSDPRIQTIGENGRRIDGRKRRSRRDGERRERGHEEAGREVGRVEGDERNQREEFKGRRNAAWWQKLLCCTDTAVKEPTATCIQTKPLDKRIESLDSEGSCPREQKSLHETTDGGRQRGKPQREVTTRECPGPRNTTKDHGHLKGTKDGSFARYPGFHDFSEDNESNIPRPPQTEKPKRRRNNRHFSTRERNDTVKVPSEEFSDVCEQFKDQSYAKLSCRHDEKVPQGEKKTAEEKRQDNQYHPEKSNINIIFKLPSKMFNTCCRSSKYMPVVPTCHTNLTQDELDYIKLCVSAEEAIGKPLPCASNRKVYDYWLSKYGIALTGLLLSDSSDLETSDEEEERQRKENLNTGKEAIARSHVDRDRPCTTVSSLKDSKLPPSDKFRSDDEKTEVTSKHIEDDYPSKDKVGLQQRLILTRQNVSQISIYSEGVRDEKCEEKETLQKKQDAQVQTEVKTNQDDLVFSFVRSVTGYLDRSSPAKGQTQTQECSECSKRANFTRGIMRESPVSTRDTSTQTADQLREECHEVKDEATLTSLSPTTTRESHITLKLLQLLEGQLNQRSFHQLSGEEKSQRKNGQKAENTDETFSVKPSLQTEPQGSLMVMYPSSESLSSNSEIEVFDTATQHISFEEQSIKDSTASSQGRQTKHLRSETSLTDEKTPYKIVRREKRKLEDESEVQKQVTITTDVAMTPAQKARLPPEDDLQPRLAPTSGSSSRIDKIVEKPKRLIDTMPPPVLSCRGFLGSSVNQKGKADDSSQGSLKPTQELVTPVTSRTSPSHHAFLPSQLPPLTVPKQTLSTTNEEPCMGMEHQGKPTHQPAPPSRGITERLVASDHQRHRQLTPIEAPVTRESNTSAGGISPLAVGVMPSRRSMQLAPLTPFVGSASSTNSLQSSGNFDLGRPSRFGQLAPLPGAQEDNISKKPKGKKKKKNKKKAPEKMTKSDRTEQNIVRFPVQNINVAEEDQFIEARRLRDTDEQTLHPLYSQHAPEPPHHLLHPGRAHLQPIARQPNLSDVRRKFSAPSAHKPLTGLRRGRKDTPNIAQNVAMLRQKQKESEKKGFLEPILPREQLVPNNENNEEDHEIYYDPRMFPFHGFVPPELMDEYVEVPIPEELLYREQLNHEHHFPGILTQHGLPPREAYFDTNQMARFQLAEDISEMEDPGLVLADDDELGLDTVLALPPTRQKFWDSDFRC